MIRSHFTALQVFKGEKVSLSCDVFSYGMVLFEIFKQEIPFADIHDLIKVIGMISEGKVGCYECSSYFTIHCLSVIA